MSQYHVKLFKGERLEEDEVRIGIPQDIVVKDAKSAVVAGLADRAEVRNADGILIFQWPRTLHRV